MPILHQMQMSGNCYKVRLAAAQVRQPLTLRDYPENDGTTRKPEFLAKNPNGRVPLLEWEDGRVLPESNAIIWHLAEGTALAPDDAWARAEALSWMFFEQYSHEPYIAVARRWLSFEPKSELAKKQHLVPEWHKNGNAALGIMDKHFAGRNWLAGNRYSIADIALYGYTHCADEGGFELANFPAISRWLARVREQPGHIRLEDRG